jgi:pheromone shutdown-related protein TraB
LLYYLHSDFNMMDIKEETEQILPENTEESGAGIPESFQLPQSAVKLRSPLTDAEIILIGSVHVSRNSSQEVQQLIKEYRPDVVFIELCKSRVGILLSDESPLQESLSMKDALSLMKKNKGYGMLHVLLSEFSRRVAKNINVMPGAEFKAAFLEARNVGARVILGDRPVEVTLKRTWAALSTWERIKFVVHLLMASGLDITEEEIEKLRNLDQDILTHMLLQLQTEFPSLSRTLVLERDLFMTAQLRRIQGTKVVAVVGKGHIKGIVENWENESIDLKQLMTIPKSNSKIAYFWRILNFKKFVLVTGFITVCWYATRKHFGYITSKIMQLRSFNKRS